MEGHQQFSCFSSLGAVRSRNVEITTLNVALLKRQPKYCEIPFFFELALFSVFLIALRYIFFAFGTSTFVCFNVYVSFSGLPKGASLITKGPTCPLQFERAKFVFYKLFPNLLVRRGVDLYAVA